VSLEVSIRHTWIEAIMKWVLPRTSFVSALLCSALLFLFFFFFFLFFGGSICHYAGKYNSNPHLHLPLSP